jgi:hypothetical protein
MRGIEVIIEKLDRIAADERYADEVRSVARRDADGYRKALARVASGGSK